MTPGEILSLLMIVALCGFTLVGFPISFTLAGVSLITAGIGTALGIFDTSFLGFVPNRIFGVMTNEVLIAIPLFVFMGVMLERSKVAEELLDTMGRLFGNLRGGLAISVTVVGALLAASTGIVGATVVTMGLLSLPTMLRRGYDPALACGSITAAGTLGQIIPPSVVLVVLADQMGISVGDLFVGALVPGVMLAALYALFVAAVAMFRPAAAPALPAAERDLTASALMRRVALVMQGRQSGSIWPMVDISLGPAPSESRYLNSRESRHCVVSQLFEEGTNVLRVSYINDGENLSPGEDRTAILESVWVEIEPLYSEEF